MKLEIDIEARFAQFSDSLNKIQRDTERAADGISRSFAGIVPTLDVGRLIEKITEFGHAIAEKFTSQFEKADEFNKLSQKIGLSVESLTAFNFAAKLSDLSIESLTKGIRKLSTNLVEAQQGAGEGAKLFAALKLDPKQFEDTDQLLFALSDRVSKMPDLFGKTAIATKAFGKDGLAWIPLLNQGADVIKRTMEEARQLGLVLTEDDALAAERFNDSLKKLHLQTEGIIRTLFSGMIPVLSDVAEKFYESGREADSFKSELLKVAEDRGGVLGFLEKVGTVIGFVADQFRLIKILLIEAFTPVERIALNIKNLGTSAGIALSGGSIADKRSAFADADAQARAEFAALDKRLEKSRESFNAPSAGSKVQKFFDEQRRTARVNGEKFIFDTQEQAQRVQKIYDEFFATPEGKKARKRKGFNPDLEALFGSGAGKAEVDQSAKRLLEQQLKDFEHTISDERDLAASRNEFLDGFFRAGLVSLRDYTIKRKEFLDESVQAQRDAINSEITLLEKSKDGQKNSDKIQTQTKINDLLEKLSKLEGQAAIDAIKLFQDSQKNAAEYAKSLSDINVQLLEMQGNLGEAAKIKFEQQHAGERTRLATEVEGAQKRVNTTPDGPARDVAINDLKQAQAAQQTLDALEKNAVAQGDVNRLEQLASRIREDASAAEERAHLAAQSGFTSELESLQAINDIRKQEVESLTVVAGLYDDIAKASDDKRITQGAKAMRLEIDKLAASADLLRDKFQGVFTSAFSSFFDKITSKTGTLKEALRGLLTDVISQFAKLGQQSFVDKFFSKQGAGGGAPSFLAGLFGANDTQTAAPVTQGIATSTGGFFSQAAAPIVEGVASSFGSSAKVSAGSEAALALKDVAASSTATSFALKEFADGGVATATQQVFQSVAAGSVEQTVQDEATAKLAFFAIAIDAATEAMIKQAASAAVSGVVGGVAKADGGLITGPGTGTSDSIPAMLSNNEFVVRAAPVKQPGALQFLNKFNREGMSAIRKYAEGGMVTPASVAFVDKIQHFATGGLVRNLSQFASTYATGGQQTMAMAGGGHINLTQNFTVQSSTPRETQQQFAAAAFQGGARALKRNQ